MEVQNSLVIGGAARFGRVEGAFFLFAQLLDLLQRVHVYTR
jgi:hypothetical protein